MKTKCRFGVYLLALAGLFGCGAAWGQSTNGSIRGIVNDPSGAVVPGATVTATLNGTDSRRSATSDKDGAFDIPELAVGTYDVTAEAQGFKKFVAKAVVVSIGHVNFITVTFQVGATNDTVTVEANAVQVETTSTQLGAVMTDQSIRELPLNSRNAYALLATPARRAIAARRGSFRRQQQSRRRFGEWRPRPVQQLHGQRRRRRTTSS